MKTLLQHLPADTKRAASTSGGEYAGPCPRCGGEDRFRIWPEHPENEAGRFFCRRCDWSGDGIDLLRSDAGGRLSFADACRALGLSHKVDADYSAGASGDGHRTPPPRPRPKPKPPRFLRPPGEKWQKRAQAFVEECQRELWKESQMATTTRAYLEQRGLRPATIRAAGLGLNPEDRWPLRTSWGLEAREEKRDGGHIWLPRGVVIPWGAADGNLWKVQVRRPAGDVEDGDGPKYVQAPAVRPSRDEEPAWSSNALYGATSLRPGRPAVLVEGAFDALAIMQEARTEEVFPEGQPLVSAVACGSAGGRRPRWIAKLASCSPVLLAFDTDENEAGEAAAEYWQGVLPHATRHAPAEGAGDPAGMLEAGMDIRGWIWEALASSGVDVEEI